MEARSIGFVLLGFLFGLLARRAVLGLGGTLSRLWKRYRVGPRLILLRFTSFFYRPARPAMDWLHIRMSREFYDDLRSLGVSPLALWIEPTGTPLAAFEDKMEDPEFEGQYANVDKERGSRA